MIYWITEPTTEKLHIRAKLSFVSTVSKTFICIYKCE